MSRLQSIALGTVLAAAASACSYPTFMYGPAGDGGSGGGQAGGGGATSSTTSSSTGGGAPACSLLGDDCGAGRKCSVVDDETGTTGCIDLASPVHATYESCGKDDQCAAKEWCELRTHVCKPICTGTATACDGKCVHALNGQGYPIKGLDVCVLDCEPKDKMACAGGATCDYDATMPVQSFDCFISGNKPEGATCVQEPECSPGLVCALGKCTGWCTTDNDCPVFPTLEYCLAFDSFMPSHDGTTYGFCGG